MKKITLLILVLVLGLATDVSKSDYIFGTPINLGPAVNTLYGDFSPSISADGLSLFFSSLRPGGYGASDLWVTTRVMINDAWEEPVNLESTVNSSYWDLHPSISADGLMLFFVSDRPGGFGRDDIYITMRATTDDPWGAPVNLGSTVNSSVWDGIQCISADGLMLFFASERPGGLGSTDLWLTIRANAFDRWEEAVNLGTTVNSSSWDSPTSISSDGRTLFFESDRPGSSEYTDLWVTTRPTVSAPWGTPVNLGPKVNSLNHDSGSSLPADERTLYFWSNRPGGVGHYDLWQVSIEPVIDLNGDGIVDSTDMCVMVDHWGENYSLCDIGPTPLGDGIVDIQDLIVLAEHLFEKIPPAE